jgi:hypothetical protein
MDREIGLDRSVEGWDDSMTCYPAMFRFGNKLWLLYNGNGYGFTGLGVATWEGDLPFS